MRLIRRSLLLVVVAAGTGCRSPAPDSVPEDGFVRLDGPGVMQLVRDTRERAVILNFWATWCLPCKEEFPMLVSTAATYADRGVRIIFVSLDFPEEREAVKAFLEEQGVAPPRYLKTGKEHEFIMAVDPRWSGVLPMTQIYGPDGLRYQWEGKIDKATLTRSIETLLEDTSSKKE